MRFRQGELSGQVALPHPSQLATNVAMTDKAWIELLLSSTQIMFAEGTPLMSRLVPVQAPVEVWQHYPADDVVNGEFGSRYFYHCHPPGKRLDGEHGHFHLFLAKSAMPTGSEPLRKPLDIDPNEQRADVVHIAALSISIDGLPLAWFTTNRWVTDEWLYPAQVVTACLARFDLRGECGDPLVNDWLTAMVALSHTKLTALLGQRDRVLEVRDRTGEDRAIEVASFDPINIKRLLTL